MSLTSAAGPTGDFVSSRMSQSPLVLVPSKRLPFKAPCEHSLQRGQWHKQTATDADSGELLCFCRLVGGPSRNLEDCSSFTNRHDPTRWCAGFKSVFHCTLRY